MNDLVNELIKKYKQENCSKSKTRLLEIFLPESIKWAKKSMGSNLFSDLVDVGEGEILSLVYMAFEKTLRNYRLPEEREEGKTYMSFKNYLYYSIKFQVFEELRTTLNTRVIKGYDELKKEFMESEKINYGNENVLLRRIEIERLEELIIDFLTNKNEEYAMIYIWKLQGFTNQQIQKFTSLSPNSLKSRLQYIKKLVLDEFENDPAFQVVSKAF